MQRTRSKKLKRSLSYFHLALSLSLSAFNAFLALRKPEVEALLPDDCAAEQARIRIHRDTKTGNDEWLPVVAPLANLLSDGWEQIKLTSANLPED